MATIKNYTSLEQSKVLAQILPLESADMWFCPYPNNKYWYSVPIIGHADLECNQLPCWSLASLLSILPDCPDLSKHTDNKWYITTYPNDVHICLMAFDNPIDACYSMIIKLHELNLL